MNFNGLIIGVASFLIIGIFHPIVIKAEYYLGVKIWPAFLVLGLGSVILSLFVDDTLLSAVIGVFGFANLWSIRELHEQEERVAKGWFPKKTNK